MKDWKNLKFVFFSVFLSPLTVAATSYSGDNDFLRFFDTVFAAEIETVPEFLVLGILPIIATYGLFRFIFTKGIKIGEQNIQNNVEHYRQDGDISDEGASASKVMALALAFIVVIYYGGSIFIVSLLSLIGGLIWAGWIFGVSFTEALGQENGDGGGNGGENTGGDGGNEGGGNGETADNEGTDWGEVGNSVGNAANTVNDLLGQRKERKIEEAFEVFEPSDNLIHEMEEANSKNLSNLRTEISDADNQIENVYSRDEDDLVNVKERAEMVKDDLDNLFQATAIDNANGQNDFNGSELKTRWYNLLPDENPLNQTKKIKKQLGRVRNDSEHAGGYRDELDDIMQNARHFWKVIEFIRRLPWELGEIVDNDEKLEVIYQKADDKNMLSSSHGKADINAQIKKIDSNITTFTTLLSEFEQLMKKELKIDKSEVKKAGNLREIIEGLKENAERVKVAYDNNYSGPKDISNVFRDIISEANSIENELDRILSNVNSRGVYENKTYQRIRELEESFS